MLNISYIGKVWYLLTETNHEDQTIPHVDFHQAHRERIFHLETFSLWVISVYAYKIQEKRLCKVLVAPHYLNMTGGKIEDL